MIQLPFNHARLTALICAFILSNKASAVSAPRADNWRGKVIYFALVDRFVNGDRSNDQAHGDSECNNPRDPHAYQGGDLRGLTDQLSYIEDLGADALWITPLYKGVPRKQGRNCGFPGYWADFAMPYQLELDPRFGTEHEFDHLLDMAHRKGMKVLLDMVVNHAGYEAGLVDQRPEWFTDPNTCATTGRPEIYCSLAGLPDFDHRRQDVQRYLIDLHLAWTRRFAIDGIRMDTVKHVEPWYFSMWNSAMRSQRSPLYIVGELLDEESLDPFAEYLSAGFDGLFNFTLRRSMIQTFAHGGSVDIAAGRMNETLSRFGEHRAGLMVNLLDNHDVRRFLEEMPAGLNGGEIRRRYLLALTALLTLPGIPQIYYGNEVGMYGGYDPDNRRFMPDWAFRREGRAGNHHGFVESPAMVFEHVKKLLTIRRLHPSLRTGRYHEVWRQNGPHNANVWAYLRDDEATGDRAIVVINNGARPPDEPLSINVIGKFADGAVLKDQLGQAGIQELVVSGGKIRVYLPGRTAIILTERGD